MFSTVLIANRGEIAARIARTCRRLGVKSVAIYSEADRGAPHVEAADAAVCVGAAPVSASYLNVEAILAAARAHGAEAIHPGYGLLSENAAFARAVVDAGMAFVGPSPEVIEAMGDKAAARSAAEAAGVPVVPGTPGPIKDDEEAIAFAERVGYPVLVKAAAGGGGIGMQAATKEKRLIKALAACRRRASSSFGDETLYLEKYIETPRHLEVQIVADEHGEVIHLFERECSVQRRHQKVIEEAPSTFVEAHEGLRAKLCEAAVQLARAVEYVNAGTVEFIAAPDGSFYFIEMNTRLQVEHPVTEMVTGLDLVEVQLKIASGERAPWGKIPSEPRGAAIECRIYAENPEKNFMPAPGTITTYREPEGEGIRVDSGVKANWEVTPHYDPMIAKICAHASGREAAIERMAAALSDYEIGGLTTNLEMHRELMLDPDYRAGEVHTGWLEARAKE